MEYYTRNVIRGLNYSQALELINKDSMISIDKLNGVHFKRNRNRYILVYNKESGNWCLVLPTEENMKIIKHKGERI